MILAPTLPLVGEGWGKSTSDLVVARHLAATHEIYLKILASVLAIALGTLVTALAITQLKRWQPKVKDSKAQI